MSDFYNNKAACDEFLTRVVNLIKRRVSSLKGVCSVASDTANIKFKERGGIYNGRSYCGIQISIKRENQVPMRSNKLPYGC